MQCGYMQKMSSFHDKIITKRCKWLACWKIPLSLDMVSGGKGIDESRVLDEKIHTL